jgi:hypothetical protein
MYSEELDNDYFFATEINSSKTRQHLVINRRPLVKMGDEDE